MLNLGGKEISCAVLSNGKRIITQTALFDVFGRPRKGEKRLGKEYPSIIGARNLLPYVDEELIEYSKPVHYYSSTSSKILKSGYDANIIPAVCEIYLSAKENNDILESQEKIVYQANVIIRALAKVGIAALVDEATGYQLERESDALQTLLRAYISEDLLQWQSRFPRKFYQEIYRLYDWDYNPTSFKHPSYIGHFTNDYIYKKMPTGVLNELRSRNPKNNSGNRLRRHHQFLSGDIGIPHLEKHITKVITIMELSKNIDEFRINFTKIFGPEKDDLQLSLI
ncbi:hypothetical protein CYR32_13325 [Chimaeribacter coloradensis]|uniref:Bacteriophage Mx8 p63 C-terminal domain-containing protein n=1 Tax=Chimaeribacter coloradensis TaxID=2060068 RepID=A0A2N5E0J9_9GAMM|nr:hypothetical protein CYR32_13325 [Chimaeribacter coloradensis]